MDLESVEWFIEGMGTGAIWAGGACLVVAGLGACGLLLRGRWLDKFGAHRPAPRLVETTRN